MAEKCNEPWCWFDVISFKLETYMNFESRMNKTKWLISKTISWDLAEMIACKCADECLKKRYYYNVDRKDR